MDSSNDVINVEIQSEIKISLNVLPPIMDFKMSELSGQVKTTNQNMYNYNNNKYYDLI